MLTRRHLLAASTAGLLSSSTSFVLRAFAQAIKKPARVIVGFPAGGGTDVIARILADGLRGPYASTVLVGKQARRRGAHRGRIREECGAGRKRDAVHAGLSDDGLPAQFPLPELRPAARLHRGVASSEVDA